AAASAVRLPRPGTGRSPGRSGAVSGRTPGSGPGMARAPFGDEVDQLLERALLTRPVKGPDLRVPGESRLVGFGRVDDPQQILQPELPAVLGVVPGPSISKNRSSSAQARWAWHTASHCSPGGRGAAPS